MVLRPLLHGSAVAAALSSELDATFSSHSILHVTEVFILQINFTFSIYSRGGLLILHSLPPTISIYIYNLPWIIISHIVYFSVLVVPSPRQEITETVVLCLDVFSPAVIYIAIQKVSGCTNYSDDQGTDP